MERDFIIDEVPELAQELLSQFDSIPVWLFYGEMGSGKTTLIKALTDARQIEDDVSSPTYGIVHEYQCVRGSIYHLDLFRLQNAKELEILQLDEIFESACFTWIEWPQIALPLIPEPYLQLYLSHASESSRKIRILTTC